MTRGVRIGSMNAFAVSDPSVILHKPLSSWPAKLSEKEGPFADPVSVPLPLPISWPFEVFVVNVKDPVTAPDGAAYQTPTTGAVTPFLLALQFPLRHLSFLFSLLLSNKIALFSLLQANLCCGCSECLHLSVRQCARSNWHYPDGEQNTPWSVFKPGVVSFDCGIAC